MKFIGGYVRTELIEVMMMSMKRRGKESLIDHRGVRGVIAR